MVSGSLLDEAIADAKAVRATAMANAKQSLEDAFTGTLTRKFANMNMDDNKIDVDELLTELEEEEIDEGMKNRNLNIHILKE